MQQKAPLVVRLSEIMSGRLQKNRKTVVVVSPGKQHAVEVLYKSHKKVQVHV